MIVTETDRIYVITIRTNRRVQWKYAQYAGRWETPEKAIEKAKERMGDVPFEYLIEKMGTDEEITGFVNWDRKVH